MSHHRKLNLMGRSSEAALDAALLDTSPHRPNLSLWFDDEAEAEEKLRPITLMVGALHGQQKRFVELSSLEARQLARSLILVAEEAEAAPTPQLKQQEAVRE